MFVLYATAALFFGLSYLLFKGGKKALGNLFVTLALFLNPMGYDIVVYGITLLTDSYWMTMSVMYMLAGTFFILFMFFYGINPIKVFTEYRKKT